VNSPQREYEAVSREFWSSVPSLRRVIGKYVEDAFFWVITTAALTLAFPFYWIISIPTFVICGVAIYLSVAASRARQHSRHRLWYRLTTILAIVVATTWTLFGPVLIARPVLYVIIHEDWNPLKSSFGQIQIDNSQPAYLLVSADPIRKVVYSAIGQRFKKMRVSKMEDGKECPYVRLPSLQQLSWIEDEPGLGTRESVNVTAVVDSAELSMGFKIPISLRVSAGPFLRTLVDIERTTSPGMPPWHGILLGQTPGRKAFEFAVLVDLSVRAMIDGNSQQAWNLLQSCLRMGPPHVLEQARVLTLEARYADLACRGNVGGMQALLYANPAMQILLVYAANARLSSPSPLTDWIQDSLIGIFEDYRASIKSDLTPLKEVQLTPVQDRRGTLFDKKLEEWKALPTSELIHRISSKQITSLPEMVRIRTILIGRAMEIFNKVNEFFRTNSEPFGGWDELLSALDEVDQTVNAIAEVAQREGAAGSANYMKPMFDFLKSIIEALKTNADDTTIEHLLTSSPDRPIRIFTAEFTKAAQDSDFGSLTRSVEWSGTWWQPEFQDSIRRAVVRLFYAANAALDVKSLEQITKEVPLERLSKDGNGEVYLPGLFISCVVSERLKEERSSDLITQFEQLSGLDFKKLKLALSE
jgi:hypothetical protein